MNQRVGIDIRMASHTGVGRYIRCLVNALLRRTAASGSISWKVLVNPVQEVDWIRGRVEVFRPEAPIGVYSLREQLILGRVLDRMSCDIVHIPHYTFPLRPPRVPVVSTIHDLVYLETSGAGRSFLHEAAARWMIRRAAEGATRVIAVSEHAAGRIRTLLEVPPERIRVIPHGREHTPEPRSVSARDPATILYVGNHLPHKNLPFLMRVFACVLAGHPGATLVLAGPAGRHTPVVKEAARAAGIRERITWTAPADDAALWDLYARATLLAFPSRYEGFGFPVLEAMTSGLPVVASDATSIPEVAGDAAILLAPDDGEGWTRAILALLSDPARREELARKGLARAAAFSWDETARKTLALHEEVLASKRP